MQSRKGFTLIELLVVIAIIGILATIVTLQVAGAQVRSRNSRAQSDISQAGKAIEVYKTNQTSAIIASSTVTTGTPAANLNGTTAAGNFTTIFSGTETGGTSYGVRLTSTPSTAYTYGYVTDTTPTNYCIATNGVAVTGATVTGFMVNNGATSNSAAIAPVYTGSTTGACS